MSPSSPSPPGRRMASKTGATARVPAGMASTTAQSLASWPTCHGGEAKRDTTPALGNHPACGCSQRHPSQRLRITRTASEVATAEAPEPADDASDALRRGNGADGLRRVQEELRATGPCGHTPVPHRLRYLHRAVPESLIYLRAEARLPSGSLSRIVPEEASGQAEPETPEPGVEEQSRPRQDGSPYPSSAEVRDGTRCSCGRR